MALDLQERLRQHSCFDEPATPDEVREVLERLTDAREERELAEQLAASEEELRDATEKHLRTKVEGCATFLLRVKNWVSDPRTKRAGIVVEINKFLEEQPR